MFNSIKKSLFIFIIVLFGFGLLVSFANPNIVLAQASTATNKLKEVGSGANGAYQNSDSNTVFQFIGVAVNVFLGTLGTIFIILMIYAGFTWMTAAGDEKKIEKAGSMIRACIIGVIIVAGSYAIWKFVFDKMLS